MSNSLTLTFVDWLRFRNLKTYFRNARSWAFYALVLLSYGLLTSSCRRVVPAKSVVTVPPRPVEPAVQAKNTTFRYLKAKGKLQLNMNGQQQTANMNLRIRRDSAIWLSGSLVGIEGVRALLTPDSVRVIMPLQREYFVGGYEYLSQLLGVPVTFQQVQAVLLGDYFPAPSGTTPTVVAEQGRQRVSYSQATVQLEQLINLDNGRLQQLKATDSSSPRGLTVDYSDFRPVEPTNQPFAHASFVQAQQTGPKGVITSTAAINYSKIDFDRERLNFPFAISPKYKRVRK
jgi:hypothetical protein